MKQFIVILILLFSFCSFVFSQNPRPSYGGFGKRLSATIITQTQRDFMQLHKEGIKQFDDTTTRGITEIPVKVHIVNKADGTGGITLAAIVDAFSNLNKYYLKGYIRFMPLEDFSYINNDDFYKMSIDKEAELCKDLDVKNVINLYIVNTIKSERNTFCGYTHYPEKVAIDRVFITQKCLENNVSLVRQMAHYFTIYPTSGPDPGIRSEELVVGTNCETTGDEICDTPADPGLDLQTVDPRCGFVGQQQDAHSKFYKPLTDNIMSENPRDECRNKLTRQQYQRIMYAAAYIRNYLSFPSSEQSKKLLKGLEEKYGQQGDVVLKIDAKPASVVLNKNLYKVQGKVRAGGNYSIELVNYRKGYIYVIEGDSKRGVRLIYPLQGDQQFFKDEKKQVKAPSDVAALEIDAHPGANYICVLFSKKQLPIQEYLDKINKQDSNLNIFQRFYAAFDPVIVSNRDINYSNSKIEFTAISTERFLVPIFIELEHD